MEFHGLDAAAARAFAEWHATIPLGDQIVEVDGVCTVQLRAERIYANRVFFDRSALLALSRQERGRSPAAGGTTGR